MKKQKAIIHLLIWGLLILIPFIAFSRNSFMVSEILVFYTHLIIIAIVFYVNYLYLIKHTFYKNVKTYITLGFFLVLLLAFCTELANAFIRSAYSGTFPPPMPLHAPPSNTLAGVLHSTHLNIAGYTLKLSRIFNNFTTLSFVFLIGLITRIITKRNELEKDKIAEELKTLRAQLNPHFLFNTLNNIYSLININPQKAQESVHSLSNLLRYVLYEERESSSLVTFKDEINFINDYIKLHKLRFGDSVKINLNININESDQTKQIAPLLSLCLIENAFKYGVLPPHDSTITISLYRDGDNIVTRVENTIFPQKQPDPKASGIGLKNLRRRLDLHFPNAYKLNLKSENNQYIAEMITPLKR